MKPIKNCPENDLPENINQTETKQVSSPIPLSTKKTNSLALISFGCIFIIIFLVIFINILPFLNFFPKTDFSSKEAKIDKIIEEQMNKDVKKNANPTLPISPAINNLETLNVPLYKEVPFEVKNLNLDCTSKDFIPERFRNNNYYCKNIYQIDPNTFRQEMANVSSERLLLYGQYLYFDCPLKVSNIDDVSGRCYKTAKFTDNQQIPIMMEILGMNSLKNKAYFFFETSFDSIHKICNHPTASACFINDNVLVSYLIHGGKAFYNNSQQEGTAYEGFQKEIKYSFFYQNPSNCYSTDTHELFHYLIFQKLGFFIGRQWFDEGMAHSLSPRIYKKVCPPGPVFTNISKTIDGKSEPLNFLDLGLFDLDEPLSAAVESYCDNNSCCKAIFKEQARLYKEGNLSYLSRFYEEIPKMLRTYETDYAKALYISEGSPEWLKKYFRENGCTQ